MKQIDTANGNEALNLQTSLMNHPEPPDAMKRELAKALKETHYFFIIPHYLRRPLTYKEKYNGGMINELLKINNMLIDYFKIEFADKKDDDCPFITDVAVSHLEILKEHLINPIELIKSKERNEDDDFESDLHYAIMNNYQLNGYLAKALQWYEPIDEVNDEVKGNE